MNSIVLNVITGEETITPLTNAQVIEIERKNKEEANRVLSERVEIENQKNEILNRLGLSLEEFRLLFQ